MFKPLPAVNNNLRCEDKRVLIAERNQLPKSIFNIGQTRHNVWSKADLEQSMRSVSDKPTCLLEWKEDTSKQRFERKIQGKIGEIL